MRQVAVISNPVDEVCRVMVYDAGDAGVYLFLYRSFADGPGFADYWFESVSDAVESARSEYGVGPGDWLPVPDPQPGCQHDWVAPVRVKCGPNGQPLWGQFEPLAEQR